MDTALQPTGRLTPRDQGVQFEIERAFTTSITSVWEAITENRRLSHYIGHWTGDPASGTIHFQMTAEPELEPEVYHILECVRPKRLVVQIGETPDDAMPAGHDDHTGPWVVEFNLVDADGAVHLAMRQQIRDKDLAGEIAAGWEYYLDRLVAAEHGEDAEEISFEPYSEMAAQYQVKP